MKKKRKSDSVFDVSGRDIEIDERGRVKKDRDSDEAARRTGVKKKKRPTDKTKPVFEEVPDKKFKSGMTAADGKSPKKKKKRKGLIIEGESKQLATITPKQAQEKTAKKKAKALKAIEEFALLPDSGDEFDCQYRSMFENAVDLASRLEQQMSEKVNGRDVYALNTLYSQIRELIADMRATRDIGQQISEIERTALNPYTKQIGQLVLEMFFAIHSNVTGSVKQRDVREDLLKRLGDIAADTAQRIQNEHAVMVEKLHKVMA
jgi:hypothetical protein